ncbi:hypothetical protein SAMN04487968_101326 [Nocardioides terrae]|uniref:Uncharacterized protein n=1 Tax=Nocardioides terrae TaxID=574651 RepID=A0A1I1DM42_9ACTN|nr:DUF5719 family protein [Nocardioides terrae]SFB75442.1 hypothetical protein SAMN04487968_101326 [Nocardioides terrae]
MTRRRIDVTTGLAIALPVVVALLLVLVRPDAPATHRQAPATSALTTSSVVCPSSLDGRSGNESTLRVASASGATGALTLTSEAGTSSAQVAPGRVVEQPAPDAPVVVGGQDNLAPGIVAGLSSSQPLTALDCTPVAASQWFTGVGAGPTHASVLVLTNPNAGQAVAEVGVLGDDGPLDVPALRGVAVEGGSHVQIDLGSVVPQTGDLALHVVVQRGQLGVAVRDRGERLTGGTSTEDWLQPQLRPARRNLLLGVTPGAGRHTLTLANDTDDQATATVRLVTAGSVFAPAGATPITVPPHAAVGTVLDDLLGGDTAKDAIGIEVVSDHRLAASLRSVAGGDLSLLAPGPRVFTPTTAVMPEGAKRLVLAGADAVGVATVIARAADGAELLNQRVSLALDQGATLDLPDKATSIEVSPQRTAVRGVVQLQDGGSAVVRLRELVRAGAVPAVAPGTR